MIGTRQPSNDIGSLSAPVVRAAIVNDAGCPRTSGADTVFGGTNMDTFSIPEWRKSQRYTDRRPKFFSVYSTIREEIEFSCANAGVQGPTDSEMGQILGILCLATKHDNPDTMPDGPSLPFDAKWVQKQAGLDSVPDLKRLVSMGVISCNKLLQVVTDPVVSVTREEKRREEKSINNNAVVGKVLTYLNEKAGKKFATGGPRAESSAKMVADRLRQGFTEAELLAVIDLKCGQWKNGEMDKYLRPATLFNKTKFEQYVGEIAVARPSIADRMAAAKAEAEKREAKEIQPADDKPFLGIAQMILDGEVKESEFTRKYLQQQRMRVKASQQKGEGNEHPR